MESSNKYRQRLEGYSLSQNTKKQYLYYYKKLYRIMGAYELNVDFANAFLKDYPNSVCMAFLNDYSKWKALNIQLENRIVKRKRQKDKTYITPQEIKVISKHLRKTKGIKYQIMLLITYHCALRRMETVGIHSRYLFRDFKIWKEDKTKPLRLTIHKKSAKGEKEGIAIIPSKLANALFNYVRKNLDIIRDTEHKNDIFRVKERRWSRIFTEGAKECLNEHYTLHELRYSKATFWWRIKGFDIVTIQKLLRHVDIKTTQTYIDPSQESALRELEDVYRREE